LIFVEKEKFDLKNIKFEKKHLNIDMVLINTQHMKKSNLLFSLLASILILASFTIRKDDVYSVENDRSTISWSAKKVLGGHVGTVKITSGTLVYDGKGLKGGSFVMDLANLTSDSERLTTHLKNDDFFSVDKYPTSKFDITKVSPAGTDRVNITGNLTIKGITHPITFPASVKQQKGIIVAVASGVKVDRTKYDIKYRSKNFFGDIGDKAIEDEFELNINLSAKKK
jgi:polyisoprenoid-binding protein YceI